MIDIKIPAIHQFTCFIKDLTHHGGREAMQRLCLGVASPIYWRSLQQHTAKSIQRLPCGSTYCNWPAGLLEHKVFVRHASSLYEREQRARCAAKVPAQVGQAYVRVETLGGGKFLLGLRWR